MLKRIALISSGLLVLVVGFNNAVLTPDSMAPRIISFPSRNTVTLSPGGTLGYYTLAVPNRDTLGAKYNVPLVCVDSKGDPRRLDPMSPNCTRTRPLRIGEPLYYYRHDYVWDRTYLVNMAVPTLRGRSSRVLHQREWGSLMADEKTGVKRALFDYDDGTGGDGYDVIEMDGAYSSTVGTRDPITTSNSYRWFNKDCKPADGWIFFDNKLPLNTTRWLIATLVGAPTVDECKGTGKAQSLTVYHKYPSLTYTSGKKMRSIVSWHYGAGDATKDLHHLEQFYFTEEYGLTRWERWETLGGCRLTASFLKQNPDVMCSREKIQEHLKVRRASKDCSGPDEAHMWGQYFFRWGCGDWSFASLYDLPQHPYSVPLSNSFATLKNLLKQADFAEGRRTAWKTYPGTKSVTPRPIKVTRQKEKENSALRIPRVTGAVGHSIYQDVAPGDLTKVYGTNEFVIQSGLKIRSPDRGHATVVVFLFDARGRHVADRRMRVSLDQPVEDALAFHFRWDLAKIPLSRIRFQVYFDRASEYVVDDTFLAILPSRL